MAIRKNSYEVYTCPTCDTPFIDPIPARRELERVYTLGYFEGNPVKFGCTDYESEAQ